MNKENKERICKNCQKPIVKFQSEWWHISRFGEYGHPSIDLQKRLVIGFKDETCKSCGHQSVKDVVCINPEPKEE